MFLPSFVELPPVTFPGVPGIILVFPPTPALLKSVTIYYSCLLLTPSKKQTVYKPYQ